MIRVKVRYRIGKQKRIRIKTVEVKRASKSVIARVVGCMDSNVGSWEIVK